MLIAARAVQGVGAALAATNALALIATSFSDRRLRDSALALYGAMSGLGIIVGLLLGGVLTDLLGWRWVFFVNVPIGMLVLLGSRTLVPAARHRGRVGILGAILGTGGMVALVLAITRAGEHGLTDPGIAVLLALSVVLLGAFVLSQRSSSSPLVPLRLFADRRRSGAYLSMLGLAIGLMGTFYVVTLYLQDVQHLSPLATGLSWLPFALGIVVGAAMAPKLLQRAAPGAIAALGAVLGAAGVLMFSRIGLETPYWAWLVPAMLLIALGFGIGVMALTQAAVYGVEESVAGIVSALLNSAQQIGVALGLAVLAGVAATVAAASDAPSAQALVDGYSTALVVGTGILLATAVLALIAVGTRRRSTHDEAPAPDLAAIGGPERS